MTEISGRTAAQPGDSGQHDRRGREAALARAFVRLADTLASDFNVVDFLQGLSADAVEILEAEAAGVMLADPRGGLRLIASSDERMRLLSSSSSRARRARAWTRSPRAGSCRRAQPAAALAGRSSRNMRLIRASS